MENENILTLIDMARKALDKSKSNNSNRQIKILSKLLKDKEIQTLIITENSSQYDKMNFTNTVQLLKKLCETYKKQTITTPDRVSSINKYHYKHIELNNNHKMIDSSGFDSLYNKDKYWFFAMNIIDCSINFFVRRPQKNTILTKDNIDKHLYILIDPSRSIYKFEHANVDNSVIHKVSINTFIVNIGYKLLDEFISEYNNYSKQTLISKVINLFYSVPSFCNIINTIVQNYMNEPRWIPGTVNYSIYKNDPIILNKVDNVIKNIKFPQSISIIWHGYVPNYSNDRIELWPYYYILSSYNIDFTEYSKTHAQAQKWFVSEHNVIDHKNKYNIYVFNKNKMLSEEDINSIMDYCVKHCKVDTKLFKNSNE